ncbi:MAG: DUF2130 domain-containing protein [Malacoplasma sp.]|nr:DUF2130 domain-containing protein [Malacoplasma sp.]MDE7100031.1 DUF2130 domain-containing protein [Malacoplasma sp.]
MSKKIRIEIKDKENLEFKILDKAEPGDFFSLNEINEFDFSELKKQIEDKENEFVNERLKKEKINWTNEFKQSSDYKSLENKIHDLEKVKEKLENELENRVKLAISDTKRESQEEISNLKNQIDTFKLSMDIEKNKITIEKDEIINNLKTEKNNEINDLRIKISNANKDKELALQEINSIWEIKWKDKENELINKHKEEIDEIERKRLNVKTVGEDLEKWIQDKFDETFGMIDGCTLEKTTKNIGGHKPDFLFSVYDNNSKQILGKVTIEAKSQKSVTETSKKNRDHFQKLEMDRINHNSEFALLVSELEPDEAFYIKKVPDENYPNMFIVRPQFFITFLSIVRYIWIKKGDILRQEINFEKKQTILDDFNLLKNEILSNSLRHIESNIQEILKAADSIEKSAIKIKEKSEKVLESHLNTIKTKIENFKITKIIKEIEKTED